MPSGTAGLSNDDPAGRRVRYCGRFSSNALSSGVSSRVNFVAHAQVALAASCPRADSSEVAYGAALPDLCSMAGIRMDRSLLPEAVGEGVALHHRTDTAFHSLAEFTTGAGHLRELLKAAGLPVGASRAVGHAGWELLLDGCLLERAGVEESFARVLEDAPEVVGSVSPGERDRWRSLVSNMGSDRWWVGYRDPELVAVRLQRLLRARRRLSYGTEQIPLVAGALAVTKPVVDTVTDQVMGEVSARLAADGM